jgi:DNA ligase (NAD+)
MTTSTPVDADALERIITEHNHRYWNEHAPTIGDQEYDQLVNQLRALRPNSAVLRSLGEAPPARGSEVKHSEPMLSLDKCYDDETLQSWLKDIRGDVVVMPKVDGLAISLVYEAGRLQRAATRGDGEQGEDLTANVRGISDIPAVLNEPHSVEVRGEIYMSLDAFARYAGEKANPRNLAAGALRQKDPEKTRAMGLSFWAYDVRRSNHKSQAAKLAFAQAAGVTTLPHQVVAAADVRATIATLESRRGELAYETDGIVLVANDVDEHARLGATAHHPRYALAWKFQGDEGQSVLRSVEWSVARTGTITPVAIVDPVLLSGVTVTRASLHNLGFIEKLTLSTGASLAMVRRGGVIPHVERVLAAGSGAIEMPTTCPSCGEPTTRQADFLFCSKPTECTAARVGRLVHFCAAIDVQGLGDAIIERLVRSGHVRTPADLYRLSETTLANVERSADKAAIRVGEKNAQKIRAELERKRSLPLDVFLRSLGIDNLGKTASKALAEQFGSLAAVRSANVLSLQAVRGVGELVAEAIVVGLQTLSTQVDDLLTCVQVQSGGAQAPVAGVLSGKSFLFTGALAFDRKTAEQRVVAAGGAVASSVTKNLQYLVVGASDRGKPSSKLQAAQKLQAAGVALEIIDEVAFEALLQA